MTHREENFCLNPKYRCFAILSRRSRRSKDIFALRADTYFSALDHCCGSLRSLSHQINPQPATGTLVIKPSVPPGNEGKMHKTIHSSDFFVPNISTCGPNMIHISFKKKRGKNCWERPMAAIGRKIGSACAGRQPVISHVIGSLNFKLMPSRQSRRSPREQ